MAADALSALSISQLFVINLARRRDRRDFMEAQLKALPPNIQWEIIVACDGLDGEAAPWWMGRRVRPEVPAERRAGVAGCHASWEVALSSALRRNRFPCMILEDDITLEPLLDNSSRLRVPADADLVALANGPNLHGLGLGDTAAGWLTKSTAAIRSHAHSTGAMLLPNAAGCRKLLSFLKTRSTVYHIDRVMQSEFAEAREAQAIVYHAIPSLYGWIESASDVAGAEGWVRPASPSRGQNSVQRER